jgi:hypothetical protein
VNPLRFHRPFHLSPVPLSRFGCGRDAPNFQVLVLGQSLADVVEHVSEFAHPGGRRRVRPLGDGEAHIGTALFQRGGAVSRPHITATEARPHSPLQYGVSTHSQQVPLTMKLRIAQLGIFYVRVTSRSRPTATCCYHPATRRAMDETCDGQRPWPPPQQTAVLLFCYCGARRVPHRNSKRSSPTVAKLLSSSGDATREG